MKLPRSVIVAIAALAAIAGSLGLIAGMNSGISETQVINAGASVWVAETGGALTDCVGLPGDAGVWIEVRCSDGAQDRTYLFDKRGTRLAPAQEPQT